MKETKKWLAECRGKTQAELKLVLASLLRKQFKLKLQKVSGELNNKSRLKQVRRAIARLKTLLSEGKSKENVGTVS